MTNAVDPTRDRRVPEGGVDLHLARCVAHTLRVIEAARVEREDAPVKAARRHLAEIYGVNRLSRRMNRPGAQA